MGCDGIFSKILWRVVCMNFLGMGVSVPVGYLSFSGLM